MQDMRWLDHLPDGTLASGVELANRLYWHIKWEECGQQWCVWAGDGEDLLLRTDTREALEAFLYGLGLAYAVLPEDTIDHLVYWVKGWVEPEDITPEERARFGGAARSTEPQDHTASASLCLAGGGGGSKMSRASFIRELVELLLRMEGGMLEFEDPLPQQTKESLMTAVGAFGDEALPTLLERFSASFADIGHGYLIDVLKRIGNPAAVPALIAFHRDYGTYQSRAGAMSALRALDTEASYTYMTEVVTRYALGNTRVVDSTLELVIACRALGEWGDGERAVPPLMAGAQIHLEGGGMPQAAIEALGRYPVAQKFLAKLASQSQGQSQDQSAPVTPESGGSALAGSVGVGEEDTNAGTVAGTAATASPSSQEDQEQQP